MSDEKKTVIDGREATGGQFHQIERLAFYRPEMSDVMWVATRLEVAEMTITHDQRRQHPGHEVEDRAAGVTGEVTVVGVAAQH
jgi:hypothetical protein